MNKLFFLLLISFGLFSCGGESYSVPKPRMYPKVDYPVKAYQEYKDQDCPLSFEYPAYAEIKKKKNYYGDVTKDDCWFNIEIKPLKGTLHCSYYSIDSREKFDKLVGDAFELVAKHRIKTNYRDELVIRRSPDMSGILFQLDGAVASPIQFFLTDTLNHFFRASLYFDAKVNVDSIAPIQSFVEEDIVHMIDSFNWE